MRIRLYILTGLFLILRPFSVTAFAHQPRLVGTQTDIIVDLPEISKAYYGSLAGEPAVYRIEATEPFRLYVNVLVPDIAGIDKDVSAQIRQQGTVIANLTAADHNWQPFFEPFAGDAYFRGPEFTAAQEPGIYEIEVYSPDNRGKYVLAVGDKEAFPFWELVGTYAVLPRLKSEFFGKSPFSAYWNIMGIFLLGLVIAAVIGAAIVFCIVRFIRKRAYRLPEKP